MSPLVVSQLVLSVLTPLLCRLIGGRLQPDLANSTIPPPSPINSAPTSLSLTGFSSGTVYTIVVVAVSQSGVVSNSSATFTWHVLASAPSVSVTSQPDAFSGSVRPRFTFAANWGTASSDGADAVVYEVLLLGDTDLGAHHTPPWCNASAPLTSSRRDCLERGCNASSCSYSVYLAAAQAYTLQIRTRLFSSVGSDTAVQWTFVRCSATQYGQLSGLDTLTCLPCPVGADCSGLGGEVPLVSSNGTGADSLQGVVQVSQIVAQPGYWASATSAGLTYYRCPIPEACVSGGNGSRAQCATGYMGVACR